MIICEIIVHLFVIVQNNKRCTVHGIKTIEQSSLTSGAFLNVRVLFRALLLNGCTLSFRVLEVSISEFDDEVTKMSLFYVRYASFSRVHFLVLEVCARHFEILRDLMKSL